MTDDMHGMMHTQQVMTDDMHGIMRWMHRSEWHRFNLNRKLLQLPCLAEEEFVVAEGLSVTTT